MVGALADWFAVTALFKHPLGIPIPHTAIIKRKKDQLGEGLGAFVRENFLSPEVVETKLRDAQVAGPARQVAVGARARRAGRERDRRRCCGCWSSCCATTTCSRYRPDDRAPHRRTAVGPAGGAGAGDAARRDTARRR